MKNNKDTFLFDLDGTLVDTYELILQSFMHTFDHYAPGTFTREDCIPFIGPTLKETFESIFPEKAEEMIAYYRKFNHEYHDELVREFEGVYETIQTLHEAGMKLAVVTTKIKKTALRGLEIARLAPFFEHVIALEDVKNPKPDPEPILKALKLLDSTPEKAVMVGDSHHDILGAKNAGVTAVGVSWTIKGKDYLQSFKPDIMIDNMRELLELTGGTPS